MKTPRESINIALVGKYVELEDAYFSVRESLCLMPAFTMTGTLI